MTPTNPILLVLLFRDGDASLELGPPLWAAFQEVEQFYQVLWPKQAFRRVYLASRVPDAIRAAVPLDWEATHAALSDDGFWRQAQGRYTRTFDQERLGELVREHLIHQALPERSGYVEWLRSGRGDGSEAREPWDVNQVRDLTMILVTDVQITPPPEWRYIIWDDVRAGWVISIAPTDPKYWQASDEDRAATIKHRIRTACLCTIGELLGLGRCQNPACLLYADVESASVLDDMILLGPEHRKRKLTDHGFDPCPRQPAEVQPIVANPGARGDGANHE